MHYSTYVSCRETSVSRETCRVPAVKGDSDNCWLSTGKATFLLMTSV